MLPLSPPLGKGPKLPRRLFLPLATLPLTLPPPPPPPDCDVNVSEQTAVPKQSSRKERFTQMARTTSLPFFLPQQDLRIAARFHAVRWVKLCDATWKGTGPQGEMRATRELDRHVAGSEMASATKAR